MPRFGKSKRRYHRFVSRYHKGFRMPPVVALASGSRFAGGFQGFLKNRSGEEIHTFNVTTPVQAVKLVPGTGNTTMGMYTELVVSLSDVVTAPSRDMYQLMKVMKLEAVVFAESSSGWGTQTIQTYLVPEYEPFQTAAATPRDCKALAGFAGCQTKMETLTLEGDNSIGSTFGNGLNVLKVECNKPGVLIVGEEESTSTTSMVVERAPWVSTNQAGNARLFGFLLGCQGLAALTSSSEVTYGVSYKCTYICKRAKQYL